MAGVTYTVSEKDGQIRNFVVYTKKYIFTFGEKTKNNETTIIGFSMRDNPLGEIPIYEYPANNARLGAFEIVLPFGCL